MRLIECDTEPMDRCKRADDPESCENQLNAKIILRRARNATTLAHIEKDNTKTYTARPRVRFSVCRADS
jgi:hypothetical protein